MKDSDFNKDWFESNDFLPEAANSVAKQCTVRAELLKSDLKEVLDKCSSEDDQHFYKKYIKRTAAEIRVWRTLVKEMTIQGQGEVDEGREETQEDA